MKKRLNVFLAALMVVLALPEAVWAQEQETPGILDIFDRFVVAEVVATRCSEPEPELVQKYQTNFMTILPAVFGRIGEMKPEFTKQQKQAVVEGRRKMLRQNVVAIIEKMGCKDETIQNLLVLYRVQAEWDPYSEVGKD